MNKEELEEALNWCDDIIECLDNNCETIMGSTAKSDESKAFNKIKQAAENWLMVLKMEPGFILEHCDDGWWTEENNCKTHNTKTPEEALKAAGLGE